MDELFIAAWVFGCLAFAWLMVVLARWTYRTSFKFVGGMDNVVAPPPPMLSSGETNPFTQAPAPTEYPQDFSSESHDPMANCVQYTAGSYFIYGQPHR